MIIFTAGYPWSGKTELVREITSRLPKIKTILVDPVALRVPEYETLSKEDQEGVRIAAWQVAVDTVFKSISSEPDSTLIIFDTCGAKSSVMEPLLAHAKLRNHTTFYVFVRATLQECSKRAGTKWPANDVIGGYIKDFTESVPRLKSTAKYFVLVKNSDDSTRAGLKGAADRIVKALNATHRVPKPAPARGPSNRTR